MAESVSVSNSTFESNVAQSGEVGGLRVNGSGGEGSVLLFNTRILNNRAATGRGGLGLTNNAFAPVILRDVTVTGNTAQYIGGADLGNNLSVLVSSSTFSSNVAKDSTGGGQRDRQHGKCHAGRRDHCL